MTAVKIAPSILSADFTRLGDEIRAAADAGADWIHLDVMDGHFVPNISFGPMIVRAARGVTTLPLDVHLMIEAPERYVGAFADAGAHSITVHQEACRHLHRAVEQIHGYGVRAGLAINPATPCEVLTEILEQVDLVLVMSVNPGFGGQSFIPGSVQKVARVRQLLDERGRAGVEIEVDGGIDAETAPQVVRPGATVLVAGSALFGAGDGVAANLQRLRGAADGASGWGEGDRLD